MLKESRNLSNFLFRKFLLICVLLYLSLKKIVRFVSKLENLRSQNWISWNLFIPEYPRIHSHIFWTPVSWWISRYLQIFRELLGSNVIELQKVDFYYCFSPFLNFKIPSCLRKFEIVENWFGYETNDYGIHM